MIRSIWELIKMFCIVVYLTFLVGFFLAGVFVLVSCVAVGCSNSILDWIIIEQSLGAVSDYTSLDWIDYLYWPKEKQQ